MRTGSCPRCGEYRTNAGKWRPRRKRRDRCAIHRAVACLTIHDTQFIDDASLAGAEHSVLDPKWLALIRLAGLIAVGGAVPSYGPTQTPPWVPVHPRPRSLTYWLVLSRLSAFHAWSLPHRRSPWPLGTTSRMSYYTRLTVGSALGDQIGWRAPQRHRLKYAQRKAEIWSPLQPLPGRLSGRPGCAVQCRPEPGHPDVDDLPLRFRHSCQSRDLCDGTGACAGGGSTSPSQGGQQ
jgi:hypothetical protein